MGTHTHTSSYTQPPHIPHTHTHTRPYRQRHTHTHSHTDTHTALLTHIYTRKTIPIPLLPTTHTHITRSVDGWIEIKFQQHNSSRELAWLRDAHHEQPAFYPLVCARTTEPDYTPNTQMKINVERKHFAQHGRPEIIPTVATSLPSGYYGGISYIVANYRKGTAEGRQQETHHSWCSTPNLPAVRIATTGILNDTLTSLHCRTALFVPCSLLLLVSTGHKNY